VGSGTGELPVSGPVLDSGPVLENGPVALPAAPTAVVPEAAPEQPYERAELVPEIVRHAEQLRIGTVWVPAQTVRVTRHIVTEMVTLSVEVRREVVSVEHLPVPDGAGGPGGVHDAAEHLPLEVVLSQEIPVVTLQTRPYERVRVGVQEFDGETTVRDQVRVEQVEIVTVPPPATPAQPVS